MPNFRIVSSISFSLLALLATSPLVAAEPCDSRCQALKQDLRFAAQVGERIYCYLPEKSAETGTDFAALANQLEASISSRTSDSEFFQMMRRWAAAFHDGHVNIMASPNGPRVTAPSAGDFRFELLQPATPSESLILASAPAGNASLKGAEVLSINGRPAKDAITEAERFSSASTKRMRRWSASRRLIDTLPPGASSARVRLKHADGSESETSLPLRAQLLSPMPDEPDEDGSRYVTSSIVAGNIGYLRIDAFVGTRIREALNRALDQLDGTDALLIDVRRNGGGDPSGDEVLARLIRSKITRYEISPRLSSIVLASRPEYLQLPRLPGTDFAQWSKLEVEPARRGRGWAGKDVLVLTSPNCFSACDTFVSALQVNALAEVAGEGTGGGTGTPHVFELPNTRHRFRYSVVRGRTKEGDLIEGRGTLPNFVLPPNLEERRAGQDAQLRAALARLTARVAGGGPGIRPQWDPEAQARIAEEAEDAAILGAAQIAGALAEKGLASPAEELAKESAIEEAIALQRITAAEMRAQ